MTDFSWLEDYGEDNYKGLDMTQLGIDQAYLSINSAESYQLYRKHVECQKCPFVPYQNDSEHVYKISETPNFLYQLQTSGQICEFGDEFGEFGIYNVTVENNKCKIDIVKNAVSINFPVLTVFFIYAAIFLCIFGCAFLWRKYLIKRKKSDDEIETVKGKKRIRSLDTFRGISIVIMIFVNFGGGSYPVLDHSIWNGLHFADTVFPWFMWIMGVCVPISLSSSFKKKLSNKTIFLNVLKRSIKLFCLGIFLGGGINLECLRIFGVLQRFGICYLAVTTICIFLMKRDLTISTYKYKKFCTDLIVLWKGWIVALVILFVYCLIVFLVAEDGCPQGYLGPGGLHDNGKYFSCTGGATGYIDRLILGKHVYASATSKAIYQSVQSFDPEGILGCLTSIVHVFIGVQAGVTLLVYQNHKDRLARWLCWAVITGIIGGALCGFSKEDGVIPVNKNLWSISFVMVMCSFAFSLLSICYALIDVKHWWSGKPFLWAGMNAILLYVGHSMTYGNFPIRWLAYCGKEHGTHLIALFENLWGAFFWVGVSYYWYKIKYFYVL